MARDRGRGDGDGTPGGGGPGSVADAQQSTTLKADAGRQGGSAAARQGPRQTDPSLTHATGQPGGTPTGHPTVIDPKVLDDVRRSLDRENSAAVILADRGYRTYQNPTRAEVAQARQATGDIGKQNSDPDYLLEGRVFDCYAPTADKPVRGVWWQTKDKVVKMQTQRVVINLADWRGDMTALQKQFDDWPIDDLKEVKAIKPDGQVVQIIPKL
jgi:hypothetical protein